jgi:MoaA/NifB/PqqE/SkfB family radical SAM enzyme
MTTSFQVPVVVPIRALWDVTYGCNFRCEFCYSSSGRRTGEELSTPEAKALIDKLHEGGILFLTLLGGEPFFRQDILEIIDYSVKKGMIITFSTNASLITREVAEALSEVRNSIQFVQVSLYGCDEESYRRTTGNLQGFWRAMRGLGFLVEKGLDPKIQVVATPYNAHRMREYVAIAREYKVAEIRITPQLPMGRACQKPSEELNPARLWAALVEELRAIKSNWREGDPLVRVGARPVFGNYLRKLSGLETLHENCTAGTIQLYVDPNGKSTVCPFIPHMSADLQQLYRHLGMEDLKNRPFQEVWSSESFRQFREYFDPTKNLFGMKTSCRYFIDRTCVPCTIRPCDCFELVKAVRRELGEVRVITDSHRPLVHISRASLG